jgi:hypothetical protein
VNESSGPDAPLIVQLPPDEPAPAPPPRKPARDFWDKLQIMVQPLGGLFTALAIAMLGFKSSEFLNRRQAIESNTRLYSELMSKREESESALRKDMFQTIIGSFVTASGKGDLDSGVLNLELLAYNFHESLNLKPLFLDLKRRIAQASGQTHGATARAEYQGYMDRLERVAREIARKQVIVLEGVGSKFDRSIDLSSDPSGESLQPATLQLDSLNATIGIDILSVDKANKELGVSLSVETPDPKLGRQTKTATFTVSYFDFPMIDNTRLTGGDRCAIVLNSFSGYSADITVVLFPGAYASLKEKPYYSEVLESVRRENARMAK